MIKTIVLHRTTFVVKTLFISYLMCFLFAGPAKLIRVAEFESDEEMSVVNGKSLQFDVEILDKGGNVTAQPKLNAVCKVLMQPYLCYPQNLSKNYVQTLLLKKAEEISFLIA